MSAFVSLAKSTRGKRVRISTNRPTVRYARNVFFCADIDRAAADKITSFATTNVRKRDRGFLVLTRTGIKFLVDFENSSRIIRSVFFFFLARRGVSVFAR